MTNFRSQFLIDPDVIFLNHGSFGATPRPVFEIYQEWSRELERQPVQFLEHKLPQLLADSRQTLGNLINAAADDLVFVPNVTFGVNVVANSLNLTPGDEVLSTDHEYGACANVWRYLSGRRGFRFIQQPIPLTEHRGTDMVDLLWRGVTDKTRVIFISHITSLTAQLWPVEQICARAADAGILTVIDGAHTPGQINIDLGALGADFYIGNCHKWLCAPKGSAFLFTRQERQPLIQPLVIGWGWGDDRPFTFGSDYLDYLQWLGTNDLAAYLSVPSAIQYQHDNNWPAVRQGCRKLVIEAAQRIGRIFPSGTLPPVDDHPLQMAIAHLPLTDDLREAQRRFYQRHKIEIPFIHWRDQHLIRVSVQAYNTQSDIDALLRALADFFAA